MEIREIKDEKYREEWDKLAIHPLQAWEWGEFREKAGVKVARYGIFENGKLTEPIQITIHPIPHTGWNVGYYPKGGELTKEVIAVMEKVAREYKCIFIKCEPKIEVQDAREKVQEEMHKNGFVAGRSLFTKYNFVLDVTPSEEELLAAMKQKTRYNIRVAEKKGVTVELDDSPAALERYLQLTEETTKRQGFYAHSASYHRKMWEELSQKAKVKAQNQNLQLTAHLLVAKYEGQIITTWVLFKLNDTLYYPYGASTREHREVMANNLVMWEAIKLAKKWKLKYLDMWGALGPEPDTQDPWFGFHNFKLGYGARHVEYVGTWDWVAQPILYKLYRFVESARWFVLRKLRH